MPQLQQAGVFRGRILTSSLSEAKSGAMSVYITVAIDEIWDGQQWCDWREHGMETEGDIWVIKKDGQLNETQAQALINHAGWDGNFTSIANGTWKPTPFQFVVEANTFNEQTKYRISWINDYDSIPGSGNVSSEKAREMELQYGSSLRAIAGNVTRNKPPATGKPTAPPIAEQPVAAPQQSESEVAPWDKDDGPFQ